MFAPSLIPAALASSLFIAAPAVSQKLCEKDIRFAAKELEKRCGHFFKQKGIAWKKVVKELSKAAKKAKTDQQHYEVLVRLIARVRDGHARVNALDKSMDLKWPGPTNVTGPGMFWCRVNKKIYVKTSWSTAAKAGIKPGMEILKVNGEPAAKWLAARIETMRDLRSFSTDHQAEFYTCHWGLAQKPGTRMKLQLKTIDGKKKNRTLTYSKASSVANGPAYYPDKIVGSKDVRYTKTKDGWGYIHFRRCPSNLPSLVDDALAAVGDVPGMILDFRGNSGGGFDHDALMGRFIPTGKKMSLGHSYSSAGEKPYGGPVVVIVDATVRSAGETASGMFKEDGRAYMIGESPTAGMSASKQTIELPSKKFSLYVAVRSNKSRFQNGRGIEGIGVEPHELTAFDPKDLAALRDTLIERAASILADFPQKKVPYRPARFGWKAPGK